MHLNSSLEEAVSALEDVFDVPDDAGLSYVEDLPVDVFGRSVQDVDSRPFSETDETLLRNRLLAFLQVYQTQQNTEFAPRQKDIADATGLKSMQIVRMYSDLRDEGRIEGPRRQGKRSVIRILKPLDDPQRYL